MNGTDAVDRLVGAARAGDLATPQRGIDYASSSVSTMVRGLQGVDESDREDVATSGLADIANGAAATGRLARVMHALGAAERVRRADPREADQALGRLRPPPLPPGLSAETAAAIAEMSRRATAVSEVFVVETPGGGAVWLGLAPGGAGVVLIPPG
jgi:hypothetical protein